MNIEQPVGEGDYAWAWHNDVTVQSMAKSGAHAGEIIGALAQEKRALIERIAVLQSIAPKKITMTNGRVMVWHCPNELIPEVTK